MKIFTPLYDWAMRVARHKFAAYYLGLMSFAESVFFPVPVDVMLAPMSLAKPHRAWYYAFNATAFSVIGGAVGYYLGYAMYDSVVIPLVESVGYQSKLDTAQSWFTEYGIWVIFIASFTPVPYKVFTITAGMMGMLFLPFMIVSFIGRGMRFFLVAGLMKWGGSEMEAKLRNWVDGLGWAVVAIIALLFFVYK